MLPDSLPLIADAGILANCLRCEADEGWNLMIFHDTSPRLIMMVECQQVIRPRNARQYRQRSASVLPRSDQTQDSTAGNHVESPEASAAPLQIVLSRNTYERLAAAKRAQYGLTDQLRAEALAMKEHQQEELRIFREFRELAEREKRQREESLRQQQLDDLQQKMLEFETLRAIEEDERNAEVARRREAEAQMREEARRHRQAEQERILAERIAEEARIEEERIVEEARIEEERIQAEERERIRRERFRQCAVCMEEDDMGSMIQAPCAHWYCPGDLQTAFHNALAGRQPFRCCSQEIPVDLCSTATVDFRERYSLMLLELRTPNPLYCSNRACGVFLPPTQYQGPDIAACRACRSTTCRMCRNPTHAGICPQDVGMQQAVALAAQNGWKPCPRCRNMVERIYGCNHMTCRCGGEFCYVCGGAWRCQLHS
ncbi:hypothetical protein F4820DRAFT_82213 [Hypoxylon rubiginosum]|uniref:Uncharacterized protein n=1 Tax=Hypoxylon rubiginosum TaxID=110542 RepID=A0ACB9YNY7_9PEZI|nr:hypothetical protein F4820DRAFT_82213 [Hypoxylon rubiginosum]